MGAVAQLVQCCMLAIVYLCSFAAALRFSLEKLGISKEGTIHTAVKAVYDGKDTSTKLVIERSVLPDSPLHNDAGEA